MPSVVLFVSLTFDIFCRPNSSQLISQTVELLVHACSSTDHHIRLSASENLKRMIKVCILCMCMYIFGISFLMVHVCSLN